MINTATNCSASVADAVDALLRDLPPDVLDAIKTAAEDDLHGFHLTDRC
jgi:hypothetical protein